jgi:hypothetical protein
LSFALFTSLALGGNDMVGTVLAYRGEKTVKKMLDWSSAQSSKAPLELGHQPGDLKVE